MPMVATCSADLVNGQCPSAITWLPMAVADLPSADVIQQYGQQSAQYVFLPIVIICFIASCVRKIVDQVGEK